MHTSTPVSLACPISPDVSFCSKSLRVPKVFLFQQSFCSKISREPLIHKISVFFEDYSKQHRLAGKQNKIAQVVVAHSVGVHDIIFSHVIILQTTQSHYFGWTRPQNMIWGGYG